MYAVTTRSRCSEERPEAVILGVDEVPCHAGEGTLGASLFTVDHEDGIGADGHECRGHPADQEAEFQVVQVDILPQEGDRAVGRGGRKGEHAIGPAKTHGRALDDGPTLRGDLDGLALGIGEVEIIIDCSERALAVAADAHEDGLCIVIESRRGLRVRRAPG